jgi:hypothetical protein
MLRILKISDIRSDSSFAGKYLVVIISVTNSLFEEFGSDGVSLAGGGCDGVSCDMDKLEINRTPKIMTANKVLVFIVQSPFSYRFHTT